MADFPYLRRIALPDSVIVRSPRHPLFVRVTHWLTALSFLTLLVSGIAILLAHPRLYWGETGAVGTHSLIDLPLPFVRDIPIRGPGRYLHFLSAWACVLAGLYYVLSGLLSGHFRNNLLPARADLRSDRIVQIVSNHLHLRRPREEESYNVLQRLAYLGVVFVLFPLIVWTGLAMSPAVTSVLPRLATFLGGQQSARTVHFFLAVMLVLFFVIHIAMVCLAGFVHRVRAMIIGH